MATSSARLPDAVGAAAGSTRDPVRQAVKVGGIQGLALTKLSWYGRLGGVCASGVGLPHRRRKACCLPAAPAAQAAAEPIYETMKAVRADPRAVVGPACLHRRRDVRRIEELVEAPVTLLSTSPERDDTILMRDPFEG